MNVGEILRGGKLTKVQNSASLLYFTVVSALYKLCILNGGIMTRNDS